MPTQWLLEVGASYLVDWTGLAAVPWLVAVGVALLALGLFVACRRSAGTLPASVATLSAFAVVSVFFVPRPQMASFVLMAVFVGAWLETVRDLRPRWWLIPLTYLWACAHGLWVAGPMLGLGVIAGLCLDRRVGKVDVIRMLCIPVLGVVAAAATPVGPRLLMAPLKVNHVSSLVAEWQPPNFREPYAALTAILVFAVIVTWSRSSTRPQWSHIFVLGGAGALTLYSARTLPLGVIVAAPLLAAAMSSWLQERTPRAGARRDIAWVALSGVVAMVLVTAFARPEPPAVSMVGPEVDSELAAVPVGTVVFNEYAFGGWLDWGHRQVLPVIDGITESYSVEYIAAHNRALRGAPGWESVVEGTDATYAVLYAGTPLALGLQRGGWTVQAEGESPAGASVILLEAPAGP